MDMGDHASPLLGTGDSGAFILRSGGFRFSDIVTLKLALIPGRGEDRVAAEISHAAMISR